MPSASSKGVDQKRDDVVGVFHFGAFLEEEWGVEEIRWIAKEVFQWQRN